MSSPVTYALLEPEQCWALLAEEPVGRLGLSVNALPTVLPVNFALLDRAIVFRTGMGSKLDAATSGSVIAFEVDRYDRVTHHAWSVLVRGVAEEIVDPRELARARSLPLEPWALVGERDRYIRIPATVVTGRILRSPTAEQGAG